MAELKATIEEITVEPHPDAERLEVARVKGFTCVVGKGLFKDKELAAYIPEQAMVPPDILEELGLTGRLSGAGKNRVKAVTTARSPIPRDTVPNTRKQTQGFCHTYTRHRRNGTSRHREIRT